MGWIKDEICKKVRECDNGSTLMLIYELMLKLRMHPEEQQESDSDGGHQSEPQ